MCTVISDFWTILGRAV